MSKFELENAIKKLEQERTVLSYKKFWTGADYATNRSLGDQLIKFKAELKAINK